MTVDAKEQQLEFLALELQEIQCNLLKMMKYTISHELTLIFARRAPIGLTMTIITQIYAKDKPHSGQNKCAVRFALVYGIFEGIQLSLLTRPKITLRETLVRTLTGAVRRSALAVSNSLNSAISITICSNTPER